MNRYPLIETVLPTIPASPNKPGVQGHGEGIAYGKNTFNKQASIYYYRFAGKPIPRKGIVYVTCEDGYFSRQVGDRKQLILTFDDEADAFRILASVSANSGTFKETLKKFQALESNEAAIAYAQEEANKQKKIIDTMPEVTDDMF